MRSCALGSLTWTIGSLALLAVFACKEAPSQPDEAAGPVASTASPGEPAPIYGQPLNGAPSASLEDVLRDPEQYTGKTVELDGYVRRVCSKKGCWMELATDATPTALACRVTFKDYGFFVPTDSQGARAVVEGTVKSMRVSARRVAHHEREGATFAHKLEDGSANEVRIVATGVELQR